MINIAQVEEVQSRLVTLRRELVLLDSDVAALYGVETKRVNEAVRNNPEKFPRGYIIDLKATELYDLRSKILTANPSLENTHVLPKAFTEKGLYMLATILRSPQATATAISIVEAFVGIRELQRTMAELAENPEQERQKSLMKRSGEILAEILDDGMTKTDSETSIELNLAVLKVKHTVKRKQEAGTPTADSATQNEDI